MDRASCLPPPIPQHHVLGWSSSGYIDHGLSEAEYDRRVTTGKMQDLAHASPIEPGARLTFIASLMPWNAPHTVALLSQW